ncbi:MAG: response regulator [Bacteroidia bacterium]|nr:response regulator [Bacteroidia bacterium]
MPESKKTSIFIVEDNEAWAATLMAKLGTTAYTLNHYMSGELCIENIQLKPDIIILDYNLLGEMTGLDTLKEIKKVHPSSYVVMFSAQEEVKIALEILENGAYDYVVKGDNAVLRVKNIIKNILDGERLRADYVEVHIKLKRFQAALIGLIALIFIISGIIYFRTCPNSRVIKADPFGILGTGSCSEEEEFGSKPNSSQQTPATNPSQDTTHIQMDSTQSK